MNKLTSNFMRKPVEHQYSEHMHKAGEAYDSFKEAQEKQAELEKQLRAVNQRRLHTPDTDTEQLEQLTRDMQALSEQILFFEGEKARLAAKVGERADLHMKGEELLGKTETKHVN